MNPALEILNRLLDSDSDSTYRLVVKALRNVVPPPPFHEYVQTFYPDLKTKGKGVWDQFRCCATDAASQMGYNVAMLNMSCSTQLVPSWVGICKAR